MTRSASLKTGATSSSILVSSIYVSNSARAMPWQILSVLFVHVFIFWYCSFVVEGNQASWVILSILGNHVPGTQLCSRSSCRSSAHFRTRQSKRNVDASLSDADWSSQKKQTFLVCTSWRSLWQVYFLEVAESGSHSDVASFLFSARCSFVLSNFLWHDLCHFALFSRKAASMPLPSSRRPTCMATGSSSSSLKRVMFDARVEYPKQAPTSWRFDSPGHCRDSVVTVLHTSSSQSLRELPVMVQVAVDLPTHTFWTLSLFPTPAVVYIHLTIISTTCCSRTTWKYTFIIQVTTWTLAHWWNHTKNNNVITATRRDCSFWNKQNGYS